MFDRLFEEQIFAQEFGIRPLFLLRQINEDSDNHSADWALLSVDAKTYLALPTDPLSNDSQLDLELMRLYLEDFPCRSMAIERLDSLTGEQRQRVRRAAKALSLYKFDEIPDALMYEKPAPVACTLSWDPELESSGGF